METTSLAGSVSPAPASTAQPKAPSNALSADFETFLRLLTTQMKNQDPTNPQDSTEFISQLAGFSAVEQQVATNQKLQELVDTLSAGGMNGLSNWIGADVRSNAASRYDGTPIDIAFTAPQDAQAAYIRITDADEREVARIPVDTTATAAQWDGTSFDGAEVEPGYYDFKVIGLNNGAVAFSNAALTYSTVVEARSENGVITLYFADGSKMPASDVTHSRTAVTANPQS